MGVHMSMTKFEKWKSNLTPEWFGRERAFGISDLLHIDCEYCPAENDCNYSRNGDSLSCYDNFELWANDPEGE